MQGQTMRPVKWTFTTEKVSGYTYALVFTATIQNHWHIYSQHIVDGGPVKTSFTFDTNPLYKLSGDVQETTKPVDKYDSTFQMKVIYFENKAVFKQLVKVPSGKGTIKGSLEYMTCNDRQCLPPETVPFQFDIQPAQK